MALTNLQLDGVTFFTQQGGVTANFGVVPLGTAPRSWSIAVVIETPRQLQFLSGLIGDRVVSMTLPSGDVIARVVVADGTTSIRKYPQIITITVNELL